MFFLALLKVAVIVTDYARANQYKEPFRAQIHFSPPKGWMNDPNGLVYYDNEYHLFYQYSSDIEKTSGISWGHAISKDLIYWENLDIAIEKDEDGDAFSGSAIVDDKNVTGFKKNNEKPIIVMFTRDKNRERESQHIWYSIDRGRTFKRYENNPVLEEKANYPINFRDPKIRKIDNNYIASLAAGNEIRFYSSPNMLEWTFVGTFGLNPKQGNHDGVWECPDLIPIKVNNEKFYVLLVSIDRGGPVVGSATQYFVGSFDGKNFINLNPPDKVMWLDYGPDNYAGITYDSVPEANPILISWASNWVYAINTPQNPWRGQMIFPRSLHLDRINGEYRLRSYPIDKLNILDDEVLLNYDGNASAVLLITEAKQFRASIEFDLTQDPQRAEIVLKNKERQFVSISWSKINNTITIDRSKSGQILNELFSQKIVAQRISQEKKMIVDIIYDSPLIEIFFDKGYTSFTVLTFPTSSYSTLEVNSVEGVIKKNVVKSLKSIWK